MMMRRMLAAMVTMAALALLAALPAAAQPYPNRPIKFVIPFPPGGGLDHTARTIQPKLQELLGQPWVIDNKAGAAGIVGAEFAKSQPADGYTVFLGNTGTMGLNPALYQKLPYDALKDFAPVGQLISNTLVAVTGPQVPANTLPEFIAWVKANPGKVSYASGGNGAITHLAGEMLKMQAGIDMLHVPYKGSAPAVTDLLGGQVQLLIDVAAVSQQHVKAGKLKALAITNTKRNAGFPELPTFDEVGLKGYQAIGWQGLFVPAGTPRPVIDRLADALSKTMADPVVKEKFIAVGSEATPSGPEAFGAFMRAEIEKWSRIARTANVKVE
jgi:tripartite-type tricarboxylate transporter receptor subunit TctC